MQKRHYSLDMGLGCTLSTVRIVWSGQIESTRFRGTIRHWIVGSGDRTLDQSGPGSPTFCSHCVVFLMAVSRFCSFSGDQRCSAGGPVPLHAMHHRASPGRRWPGIRAAARLRQDEGVAAASMLQAVGASSASPHLLLFLLLLLSSLSSGCVCSLLSPRWSLLPSTGSQLGAPREAGLLAWCWGSRAVLYRG